MPFWGGNYLCSTLSGTHGQAEFLDGGRERTRENCGMGERRGSGGDQTGNVSAPVCRSLGSGMRTLHFVRIRDVIQIIVATDGQGHGWREPTW